VLAVLHGKNYGSNARLARRLGGFATTAAVLSVVIGLSVLAGWTLSIAALLTWGAGTAMAPNSAACVMLAGLSLWLQRERDNRPLPSVSRLTAKGSAALVGLIGLLTLWEQLFRLNLGIDRLLLLRPPGSPIATARILMSPIAALALDPPGLVEATCSPPRPADASPGGPTACSEAQRTIVLLAAARIR
jgi:hypothetical protein